MNKKSPEKVVKKAEVKQDILSENEVDIINIRIFRTEIDNNLCF